MFFDQCLYLLVIFLLLILFCPPLYGFSLPVCYFLVAIKDAYSPIDNVICYPKEHVICNYSVEFLITSLFIAHVIWWSKNEENHFLHKNMML